MCDHEDQQAPFVQFAVARFDEKHVHNLIHLIYYYLFAQQSEMAGAVENVQDANSN